ncbi:MAG TPA: G/U mismatch-specific DNA glycosylase [Actinomycetota bacterium]|nr:G/U mismatch-specific DNA glycosylase [Actinomycetota bacterium]
MPSRNAEGGPWRPTRDQLEAAQGKAIDDVIAPGLDVLFSGINPGLYSGAVGHHFARPGNRFWKALHLAGFTPEVLSPFDDRRLLDLGLGITNLVGRTTRSANELTTEELREGAGHLERTVRRCGPRFLAFLGMSTYRTAFQRPKAALGRQQESIGATPIWLLPNPSGAQARYQLPDLVAAFAQLREASRTSSRTADTGSKGY